jgi:methionyl-tRNA formyltransferase
MRIVFLGSGTFSLPSFDALLDAGANVAALVTQPDRGKGRGRAVVPPPIKIRALDRKVPVLQPRRVREEVDAIRSFQPDLLVVVSYGQILPPALLAVPTKGSVNVHASLLPRYRGAAPVAWAIVRGEAETGVTTMLMNQGLDTGPALLQARTPIGPDETAGALLERLGPMGATLLTETVARLDEIVPRPQDDALATLAPLLRKEDGRIDWAMGAEAIERRIRGFHPWPGAFTVCLGRLLKVLRARPAAARAATPGSVLELSEDGILVACGEGTILELLEVQPESRRAMAAAPYARGARLTPGTPLG